MARADDGAAAEGRGDADALVTVEGLKKYYDDEGLFGDPVRAVDGVDLTLRRGETLGLVGESGCGKTTLGRTLVGLEAATAGSIRADGVEVTELSGSDLREWQRDAGMVFQDPEDSLNDRMTTGEIIREPLDAHDWQTPAERRERVFEMLDRVGLREEHYYRYPHQFSGGQRQRIGIARALALEPQFLVLDEPTSALDVSVQARIVNLLEDLQDDLGLTYLFVTHDLSVVRHIADRIAVMYLGNVVETGPTEEVFADPAHPYTAALLSAIPGERTRSVPGADRERITLRGSPPNPRDPPPGCPFATRCPAKIRPDGVDAPDAVWDAVDEFRVLLRERARRDESVTTRVARRVGLRTDESIETAAADLFDDLELPAAVREAVDEAVDRAAEGRNEEAAAHLRQAVGSVCDRETPAAADVGHGRRSECLRASDDYESVGAVLDRRHGD